MPILQVKRNKDGFDNLAGSSQGGIPLGTWASFEGDYAPNIEWLRAGTSFNANTYPALAMYLGGTTVPERFDHNRLGEWETATISADSNNPTVMQYDGYLTVKDTYTANNGYSSIFVDGVSVNQVNMAGATGDATYNADGTIIPFKKGQSIYILTYNERGTERYIAYYTHPLFIKATPTSSDSDYEGTLNAIRQTVSKKPDWQNAIAISFSELQAGYVAPADGMVVGSFDANSSQRFVLTVEDVVVAQGYFSSSWDEYLQVQCLVAKDNVIKTNATTVQQSFYYMSFVPWKIN